MTFFYPFMSLGLRFSPSPGHHTTTTSDERLQFLLFFVTCPQEMFRLLLLICSFVPLCLTGRVLILCPFNGKSHWLFFEKFIYELGQRGHEVTAITGLKYSGPSVMNYTEILIDPPYDFDAMCMLFTNSNPVTFLLS